MTNLITEEQRQRFQEYVDRISQSLTLGCLTPDEREDMANYIDLRLLELELTEIMERA